MNEIWISILESLGLAWWVEITTDSPRCIYYFGPFANDIEAEAAKGGYIEDLEKEGAQNIRVQVKRCRPTNLTIYDEATERTGRTTTAPVFTV